MTAGYLHIPPPELRRRADALHALMADCRICPRRCGARRLEGAYGLCHASRSARIASAGPHFGEESVLVGVLGSGTIFFTGCNLGCVFCQNYDISHLESGDEVDTADLAGLMLQLQQRGCHNINLVTPTHFSAQIVDALSIAAASGLELPIVWNSSGYESLQTLKLLNGIVDIYMPDLKYGTNDSGNRYSGIGNYWDIAREAIREMHRQVGDLRIGPGGLARQGLLVRHLVLPENTAQSLRVLDFLADEISPHTYVNVMDQYHPAFRAREYPELIHRLPPQEYDRLLEYARSRGLRLAFDQEQS